LVLSLFTLLAACDSSVTATGETIPKVILIIGDGMDDQQITIARNYLVGYDGRLVLDQMPVRSAVQVQTIDEDDPAVPVYVADSANSATSMATGAVTSSGRIATSAQADEDLTTIMELAIAAGFGTGIVTTASVTDATPAAFVAHINERFCEGPRDMVRQNPRIPSFSTNCSNDSKARGGRGSIAEQIAASDLDIVLGGGRQHFDQVAEGESTMTVREAAAENGFQVIDQADQLAGLEPRRKVLGLFAPGTMPVELRGFDDSKAERVERDDDGNVRLPDPFACEPNPNFSSVPTLASMTRAALEHLDAERSFMLMIESASIDKQSHQRRPCGQIGEVDQLEQALAVVLEFSRAHPETLVLVTADHGQAAKLVPETSALGALNYASPGHFARVRTREGAIMGVNYATNDSPLQEDHSGVQVPLFASGPGARDLPSMIRQADIFKVIAEHLGLGPQSPAVARR
jgi:alkaline phosphatase